MGKSHSFSSHKIGRSSGIHLREQGKLSICILRCDCKHFDSKNDKIFYHNYENGLDKLLEKEGQINLFRRDSESQTGRSICVSKCDLKRFDRYNKKYILEQTNTQVIKHEREAQPMTYLQIYWEKVLQVTKGNSLQLTMFINVLMIMWYTGNQASKMQS